MDLRLRYSLSVAHAELDIWAPPDLDLSFFDRRAARFARGVGAPTTRIEVRPRAPDMPALSIAPPTFGQGPMGTWIEGGAVRMVLGGDRVQATIEPTRGGMAFENVLRFFLSRRLVELGGTLVHAAGLMGPAGAFVFPGVSGAGKSTLTMRHPIEQRLSEDLVALMNEDGRWFVHTLPFFAVNELEVGPRREPLAGFAFICKADRVRGRRLSRRETRSRISRSIVSFAPVGLEALILERVLRLSEQIPSIELELDLSSPVWPELSALFADSAAATSA